MKQALKDQVERILDLDPNKRYHEVIVQMEPAEAERRSILLASSTAMQRRYLTISPRELAPPKAELLASAASPDQGGLSRRQRELLRASNSMSSQLALANAARPEPAYLKTASLSALEPLRTNYPLSASRGVRGQSWSSRSALLTVARDDLQLIAETIDGIGGIYSNGTISVPPVVEVHNVPNEVSATTACTWGVERIGALALWGAYRTRGKPLPNPHNRRPIKVAVLDTGVDPTHPELSRKVVGWAEFDAQGNPVDSKPHDSGKHGTHVCGTIVGGTSVHPSSNNPILGVAPDAELVVGLVLNGTTGTHAQILAGMDWAIDSGAEVINMSLGGVHLQPDVIDLYTESIITANRNGIPVVVSIGNEGAQTTGLPGNDYFAFSVGATDHEDRSAGFSGGRTQVIRESRYISDDSLPLYYSKPEVTAPGVAVRSCTPKGKYETWNGTSMAAPHVSGAIALLLASTNIRQVDRSQRAYLLQDLLIGSVEELGEAGRDHRFGFGRINVLRAVAMATDLGY